MKLLYRMSDLLINIGAYLAGLLILLTTFMIFYEVISRAFFNQPTIWATELSIYAIIGSGFLGSAYAVRAYAHITVDLLINNAGFGLFGLTTDTSLDRELEMINLNIKAVHILTKLFLQDFYQKDQGQILNVASSAGFLAGPRLNTYYATKNYVLKFTLAIYEELRHQSSHVKISCLCPGPVATEFNKVAGGKFNIEEKKSYQVAKYAIDKTLQNKLIIVPGLSVRLGLFFNRFIPTKLSLKVIYHIQERKVKKH